MDEFERKTAAKLKTYSGLENIQKKITFVGVKPGTKKAVQITVKDWGLGYSGRYEVIAETKGGTDEQYDKRSGDSLDEALQRVHWEWL